jgi:iron donor protein CyaY
MQSPPLRHTQRGSQKFTTATGKLDSMIDEATFRRESDRALESLKQSLIVAEEDGGFEAEDNNGVLNVLFEDGTSKFVFTPNTPVRQIWISAQSTSFKLEWDETARTFILPKTGEELRPLTQRLLREHLHDDAITLA